VSPATEPATDDAALVARCLDGDPVAWESLVERHGAVVWAVANRMDLSPDDAAEVFQNTWRTAVEELDRVRDPAAIGGWLARVARHQAMRLRRGYGIARKSREHVAREDLDPTLPDAEIERLEQRNRVRTAIAQVGERCAQLLGALYFEDPTPSYDEIAARFGMRIGSIGPTRARCLGKMMELMGGDDA
jgi:RNA polymerase sigma factor (sigma-70 family)